MSAAVIHDDHGRLLLVRKRGTTSFMQPGGKPEPGESAGETLRRELSEEIGVRVEESALTALGTFSAAAANEPGHVVVADVFHVELSGQVASAAAEIDEVRWVTRSDADGLDVAPLAREYFLPD